MYLIRLMGQHAGFGACLPCIELLNGRTTLCYEDPNEVYKQSFPHAQFEFVHQVHHKQGEKIKCLSKSITEGILGCKFR